ncbi:MAG TPA: EthD family reductase [Burkholderiaceae bacterium]|jgi:uncharacterized protein (TIGR02118 family)
MIKVSALYPNIEGTQFDMAYYCNVHMPMVKEKLGTALIRIEIDRGVASSVTGAPANYCAAGHLYFETMEKFLAAFTPHAQVIRGDVPNFTNIVPTVQISEVML